jgi:hypothetical protein
VIMKGTWHLDLRTISLVGFLVVSATYLSEANPSGQVTIPSKEIDDGHAMLLVTNRVEPLVPIEAITRNLSGTVVIAIFVRKSTGHIDSVTCISGDQLFCRPALEALYQWRFKPSNDKNRKTLDWATALTFQFTGTNTATQIIENPITTKKKNSHNRDQSTSHFMVTN